jgi:phosphoribosyl 1,2-cyclic phosphodiesterase
MKIRVYGSSSAGNCIRVDFDNGAFLYLDAGISPKKIKESKANAHFLVTHAHGDHSKYAVKMVEDYGATIICTVGTRNTIRLPSDAVTAVFALPELTPAYVLKFTEAAEKSSSGFFVCSVATQHDAYGSCAFVIFAGKETLFYCVDTGAIPETHRMVFDAVIIEANYTAKRIAENLLSESREGYVAGRVSSCAGHLSLDDVFEWIKPNLKYKPKVFLAHRSSVNFDAAELSEMDSSFTDCCTLVESGGVYVV